MSGSTLSMFSIQQPRTNVKRPVKVAKVTKCTVFTPLPELPEGGIVLAEVALSGPAGQHQRTVGKAPIFYGSLPGQAEVSNGRGLSLAR